jgi:hypothetical protein
MAAEVMAAVAQAEAAAATRTGTTAEAVDTAGPPTTTTQANMLRTGMRSHPQGTGISTMVTGSPFICISLLTRFCAQGEYSGYGRRLRLHRRSRLPSLLRRTLCISVESPLVTHPLIAAR